MAIKCVDMVVVLSCALVYGLLLLFSLSLILLTTHRKEKMSEKYLQWFFPLHSGLSPPFLSSVLSD
jgi:hypothetical protein